MIFAYPLSKNSFSLYKVCFWSDQNISLCMCLVNLTKRHHSLWVISFWAVRTTARFRVPISSYYLVFHSHFYTGNCSYNLSQTPAVRRGTCSVQLERTWAVLVFSLIMTRFLSLFVATPLSSLLLRFGSIEGMFSSLPRWSCFMSVLLRFGQRGQHRQKKVTKWKVVQLSDKVQTKPIRVRVLNHLLPQISLFLLWKIWIPP